MESELEVVVVFFPDGDDEFDNVDDDGKWNS